MPRSQNNLQTIEQLEKRILHELALVESMEKKLLGEEEEIIGKQDEMLSGVRKMLSWRKTFVQKLSQHKAVFSTLLATGVVLISRGIWELSAHLPFLSSSIVALLTGIIILSAINRYPNLG